MRGSSAAVVVCAFLIASFPSFSLGITDDPRELTLPRLSLSTDGLVFATDVSKFSSLDAERVEAAKGAGEAVHVQYNPLSTSRAGVIPRLYLVRPKDLCALELVRWFDSPASQEANIPFGLGWKHARAGIHCGPSEVGATKFWASNAAAHTDPPRWSRYRYEVTEDVVNEWAMEEERRRSVGILQKYQHYLLPFALFAIVALGHGIYLGITEVEESERQRESAQSEAVEARPHVSARRPRAKRRGKQ